MAFTNNSTVFLTILKHCKMRLSESEERLEVDNVSFPKTTLALVAMRVCSTKILLLSGLISPIFSSPQDSWSIDEEDAAGDEAEVEAEADRLTV